MKRYRIWVRLKDERLPFVAFTWIRAPHDGVTQAVRIAEKLGHQVAAAWSQEIR